MFDFLVEHSYQAQEKDELSIEKGDIITNCENVEEGWLRGELKGRYGLFPENFGKVMEKGRGAMKKEPYAVDSDVLRQLQFSQNNAGATVTGRTKSHDDLKQLDYSKDSFSESLPRGNLSLHSTNVSNSSQLVNAPSRPLTSNRPGNQYGFGDIFPDNQNQMRKYHQATDVKPTASGTTSSHPTSHLPMKLNTDNFSKTLFQARALYKYVAENVDELSLEPGDIITVIEAETEDEGWWRGEIDGRVGVFPDNFVEKMVPAVNLNEASKASTLSLNRSSAMNDKSKLMVSTEASSSPDPYDDLSRSQRPSEQSLGPFRRYRAVQQTKRRSTKPVQDNSLPISVGSEDEILTDKIPLSEKGQLLYSSQQTLLDPKDDHLRKEILWLKENYVSKHEFTELQKAFEAFKTNCSSRVQTLMDELDEEKKMRMAALVELDRIKRLVADLDHRTMLHPYPKMSAVRRSEFS